MTYSAIQKKLFPWYLLLFTVLPLYSSGQNASAILAHYFSEQLASELYQRLSILESQDTSIEFLLPMEDGISVRFRAKENAVLSAAIKGRFPGVYSLDVEAVENPIIHGKLTVTENKILGTLVTPRGIISIQPSQKKEGQLVAFSAQQSPEAHPVVEHTNTCGLDANLERITAKKIVKSRSANLVSGTELKTYRLAIAITGEFYQLNGGNDVDVLSVIAYSVNGISLIYESDLGVTFSMVEPPVLYNDPATDPFTPDLAGGIHRVDQARQVINANFASAAYDIGHVLHQSSSNDNWSGGGVAYLGVVCENFADSNGPFKAGGWSGSFSNSDFNWLSLFAHEIGHMFNAAHSFNGTGGFCTNGISANSAFEIGSGTTIMSYLGLCQADNNLPGSGIADNYFHTASITQMYNYSEAVACGNRTATGNTAPQIDANPAGLNYTIPVSTPFELEGTANDVDNDPVTFTWEQLDEDGSGITPTQGFIGATAGASTLAPLFRSFPPGDHPKRIFPSLEFILTGDNVGQSFEALPTIPRSMTFAFTVRDNRPEGGALVSESVRVEVEDRGGAFEVTSQNTPETFTYNGTNTITVEWNVAGTTGGNIACTAVDILFSADGGQTFSFLLASSTPNDGMEVLALPNIATDQGRIKIKGANHIFFDINNAPITINSSCLADAATFSPDDELVAAQGSPTLNLNLQPEYGTRINSFMGELDNTDLTGTLAGINSSNGNCINYANTTYSDVYPFQVSQSGTYTFPRPGSISTVSIYQEEYLPDAPCVNLLATTVYSDQITGDITISLTKGNTYIMLASTYGGVPASYNINYSGPGDLFDGVPPPGAAYAYTYLVLDQSTQSIVAFADGPDLSNAGQYLAGEYKVKGLSYEQNSWSLSALNADYQGALLTDFQNAILSQGFCIALSDNTKDIVIQSSMIDTDGDGIGNDTDSNPTDPCLPAQLAGYTGYDASNAIWSAADCDGDGIDNGTEVINGTDPYLSDLVVFDVQVFLEGPLSGESMSTSLNDFDYLPGEANNPVAGHPYSGAPWNHTDYTGMEYGDGGIPYPATVVDWVMISVRADGFTTSDEVYRAAALLHADGAVEIPTAEDRLPLSSLGTTNYIVIEHRNHLAVISSGIVVSGNRLSFDFRANDSSDPNNFGGLTQQLVGGVYAMYTGNIQQSSGSDRITFNGSDINEFLPQNGTFGYELADLNLSVSVSGIDFNIVLLRNGTFGSVLWD